MSRNAPDNLGLWRRALLPLGLALFCTFSAFAAESAIDEGPPTRAHVVTVWNPEAINAFIPRPEIVRGMVDRGVTNFTAKRTVSEAWLSLVSTQDVIGIKVYSAPGSSGGTRPAVVAGVVEGLLAAGVTPNHIVIWDKQTTDLRLAGYFDLGDKKRVRVTGSTQAGYDPTNFYDSAIIGSLVWGDLEFGQKTVGVGRKSFVSKLVSRELTKIINIPPLLNHNLAGVSGCLYSLATGSVDNVARFESDSGRLATAVPEIYALTSLSDHVVLNIVDALICQYEGGEKGYLHYSATLNELRFSKDPVALDVLSLEELEHLRQTSKSPTVKSNLDLYSNAALLELGVNNTKKIQIEHLQ